MYEYKCTGCNTIIERIVTSSDSKISEKCSTKKCKGQWERLFPMSSGTPHFNATGFYETDYKFKEKGKSIANAIEMNTFGRVLSK